jgi:hypothetical protein
MSRRGSGKAFLKELESVVARYGADSAPVKLGLLRDLEAARLATPREVERLHEAILFLRAFPDDAAVLEQAERMLQGFDRRPDLRRFRARLADTGIAGTNLQFPFFWYTARWLAEHWPDRLAIVWREFAKRHDLERILPHLLPYCETLTLDHLTYPPRTWLRLLKGKGESEAAFLIRRFEGLDAGSFGRETAYDDLQMPLLLRAGDGTPSRTRTRRAGAGAAVWFQSRPLHAGRPDLAAAARVPPVAVREVDPKEGARLIALAREAMVPRSRDLDAFEKADARDVRVYDMGEGLEFVSLGVVPQRRLMLEAVYGYLTVKNGVPIGYVLASALYGSSEVAYNVFETWRGAESAHIYGRVLAMLHHQFGSTTFAIDPFQLGHDNEEGQKSGAWWFYYKLGFRPRNAGVQRLVRRELARLRRNPRYRSSPATVHRLAAGYMFLHLGRPRADVLGRIGLEHVGLRLTRFLAERYGSARERALAETSREAMRLLGIRSLRGWTRDEQRAGRRWSPLVVALPGIERWPAAARHALASVVRAKGGRRESDFVRLFDRHRLLRRALLRLAAETNLNVR